MAALSHSRASSSRPVSHRGRILRGVLTLICAILMRPGGIHGASVSLFPANAGARLADWQIAYHSPAESAAEGLPIGNGRMGTLVWTEHDSVRMQLNRVDNFTTNRMHGGTQIFLEKGNTTPTDQLLSLGALRVTFPDGALKDRFEQTLSIADGVMQLNSSRLEALAFVSAQDDVLCLEARHAGQASVAFELWRPLDAIVGTQHWSLRTYEKNGRLFLVHTVTEGAFVSRYAVALVAQGANVQAERDDRTLHLKIESQGEPYRILLASATSQDPAVDVAASAAAILERALRDGRARMLQRHRAWWARMWNHSFLSATSPDGIADYLTRLYAMHFYLMASSSRGAYPPKFNGSIWIHEQDRREWGSQFWVWNTESLYYPMLASDQIELSEPFYRMYSAQLPLARIAARQRWGAEGAWYPETASFDGPRELPERAAREILEVLARGTRTRNQLSSLAMSVSGFDSSLAALTRQDERYVSSGRFSWITHILTSGSELAIEFWRRYEYTQDRGWLAKHAYPLLRDMLEFYRSYARLEDDGRYHIDSSNAHESFWGVNDSISDLAAIRALVPRTIRASEILGCDAPKRAAWRQFAERLAPYPDGSSKGAIELGGSLGPGTWAAGLFGHEAGRKNIEEIWTFPVFPFEVVTLDRHSSEDWATANATYLAMPQRRALEGDAQDLLKKFAFPEHARLPILAVRLGLEEEVRTTLPVLAALTQLRPNGLPIGAYASTETVFPESLGMIAFTMQEAMLQSTDGLIRLFPAWPGSWDGRFHLRARGGFFVSAEKRRGQVVAVEVTSPTSRLCRILNPWNGAVLLERDRKVWKRIRGTVLQFRGEPGHSYLLRSVEIGRVTAEAIIPPGSTPFRVSIKVGSGVVKPGLGRD